MTRIFHDEDAQLSAIGNELIAVVGYGNPGRSQAMNLRDSGLRVIVGNLADASAERARDDGFEVFEIAAACAKSAVVLLLVPDEVMPAVFASDVEPNLQAGTLLSFSSGYNIAFDQIRPPEGMDVVLVAPRMIGPGVRDCFVSGKGFPSFVCVHQDATGRAEERMLALAKGIGSTRAGCIEVSMHDEACLDLFTEQGFGPAFGCVMTSAIQTLIEAGYPPEAVLLELYLSGELAYSFEKIREVGMLKQMDFHSQTSQYGTVTGARKFADLREPVMQRMSETLESIRSGEFAAEWSQLGEKGADFLAKVKEARDKQPFADWERRARAAFKLD